MKRWLFICWLMVVFSGSTTALAEQTNVTWARQIDKLTQHKYLEHAQVGISIRSAENGKILYQNNGDNRLHPASNLKLITSAMALELLGVEHRFETEFRTDGEQHWSILDGDLYIKGGGDPSLTMTDIEDMVLALKSQGIKVLKGDLIADDSRYDSIRHSKDLPWSDEETYYGSAISALTVAAEEGSDTGTVAVEVNSSEHVGGKANIRLVPAYGTMSIVNNTKMVSEDNIETIAITREHGEETLYISGEFPKNHEAIQQIISVWNPTDYVIRLVDQALKKHNIIHLGHSLRKKTPSQSDVLISHQSEPLGKLIVPLMKYSNNSYAEIFVKEIGKVCGRNGSWQKGIELEKEKLQQLGIDTDKIVIRDGSGLSHINLVTANTVTNLLFEIQKYPWFHTYLEALPIAGVQRKEIGGTLRHRLGKTKGRVQAKTGTISTVTALSGYLKTDHEDDLVFSIIFNNVLDEEKAKKIEDEIVSILVHS
ncbi:D-alanyl-D-alanine carboxypeptidase/D-alanyl-D-alanine-endopeptidase [Bacillus suaedae]|uniref:D-alanyl-D-alanine carboxypeptidase/D-alanyl-D-alanine-endopeptidase n=1 Tax=Halalkalibacter suaedae TaxID=2822140 RepID=A0A940WUF4_9BACI|nr:D-alanyl-D-alanine carboxypeptidase/D-alanyl-D-alanine-endopeptidase [Bacillus suaedae]MBP3950448.1 D-alanyl-D-alanine carboxypeptidase/D-alanyl-D-alanine-endopeptidase [Bacillus suaedae]